MLKETAARQRSPARAAPLRTLESAALRQDAAILATVPQYLRRGQDLLRWWQDTERSGGPAIRFPLERSSNRATRSFGFYGEAQVDGRPMPVMGNVQEMFYDQTRSPTSRDLRSAEWMAQQLREFVLRYWMRISSFRQPESYVDASQPIPPPALAPLSWCTAPRANQVGFGFSQLYYRTSQGRSGAFPSYDRSAIVDQRELDRLYEWLVLKVRIFDFNLRLRPFGDSGPEVVSTLDEESYLVAHRDFIQDRSRHLPGVLGDYGIGYAFVRNPKPGFFAYGPGAFEAALELINFRVYETGYVSVRMVFLSNRPKHVTRITLQPASAGLWLADRFTFGIASRFLGGSVHDALDALPVGITLDPVLSYVQSANALTGGFASQTLCVSLQQLERAFLVQHFQQHYQTVLGSLATWRRFPDWLDPAALPPWVISGASE